MNELEASAQLPTEHPADPMTSDQGSTGSAAELQLNANTITGKATLNPNADVFQVKNVQAAPLVDQPLEGAPLEEAAVEGAGVPLANGDVIGGVEDDGGVEALVDPQGSYQENGPAPAPLPMAPLPSLVSDNLDLVPPPATALTQDAAPPGPLAAPPGPLAAPPGPLAAPPGTMAAPPGTLAAPLAAPPGTLAAPSVSAGEEVLEGAAAPTLAIGGAEAANPAPTDASAEAQTNALKTKISDQIDYYFCQENLEKDDYMWSQMDHEHYIPIATIANFHRLQQLTTNTELIKQVLQENKSVQVDEKVEKVRPVACSRIQIMLREIPKVVGEEQVQSLFDNPACPTVVSAKRDINETWFITFANESDCSRAYQYLMSEVRTFMDKPIRARIKSKVLNRNPSYQRNGYSSHRMPGEGVYAPSYAPTMPSVQPRLPIFSNTQPEGYYMDHTQPAVYPFQAALYGNLPSQILATWPQPPTAPTPQPAYLDPGQAIGCIGPQYMLNLNGYQPASIRTTPGNRHVQNYGNSRNSRNTNRQHRGGSHLERSNSESRTLGERGPTVTGGGGSRTSPRSLDGAPISTSTSLAHSFQGRGPRNSDPGHPTPLHPPQPLAHTGSGAGDSAPRGGSQADNSGGSHSRRNNFGRRRRDGNDSRNSQRQQAQNARETRLEQQFDLESNSFPPLPCTGEKNNQSLSDMHENKKSHSDVVRGGMGRSQQRGSSSSEPRLSAGPTASPAPSVSTHTPHATAHPPSQHSREAPEPTAVPVSHAASAPVTAEPAHHKAKTSHHVESKPVAEPAASTPAPAVATVSAQNVQSKPAPEPAKISYAQMLKRNNAAGQSATPQEAAPAATTSATATTTTTAAPAAKASANAEETQASASAASVVNSGRPGPRDQNHRINSPANHRGGMNGPRRDDQRDPRYGRPFSGSHGSGRGGRGRRSQTK